MSQFYKVQTLKSPSIKDDKGGLKFLIFLLCMILFKLNFSLNWNPLKCFFNSILSNNFFVILAKTRKKKNFFNTQLSVDSCITNEIFFLSVLSTMIFRVCDIILKERKKGWKKRHPFQWIFEYYLSGRRERLGRLKIIGCNSSLLITKNRKFFDKMFFLSLN
jgi:hypothetical protein